MAPRNKAGPYAWRVGAPIEQLRQDEERARAALEAASKHVAEVANAAIAAWRDALVTYLANAATAVDSPTVRDAIERHLRNLPPTKEFQYSFRIGSSYAMYVTVREINRECVAAATVIEAATCGGEPNPDWVAERAAGLLVDLGWPSTAAPSSIMGAGFEAAASLASEARHAWDRADQALESAVSQDELKRRLQKKWRTGSDALT